MVVTRFEWDETKNLANLKKQGIDFVDAAAIFSDPLHLTAFDEFESGEKRWKTFGVVDGYALIMVAHTYRDLDGAEVIRLISARRATRYERKHYERE